MRWDTPGFAPADIWQLWADRGPTQSPTPLWRPRSCRWHRLASFTIQETVRGDPPLVSPVNPAVDSWSGGCGARCEGYPRIRTHAQMSGSTSVVRSWPCIVAHATPMFPSTRSWEDGLFHPAGRQGARTLSVSWNSVSVRLGARSTPQEMTSGNPPLTFLLGPTTSSRRSLLPA